MLQINVDIDLRLEVDPGMHWSETSVVTTVFDLQFDLINSDSICWYSTPVDLRTFFYL